jgi:hypothetical protein
MAMRSLSQRQKRERAEHERKHEELLAEWGVSEQDLRRWRRHALAARRLKRNDPLLLKRYGREAAVEDLGNEEFCCDLAGKFALKSANGTGDAIGEVRDRCDRVVMELLAARYTNSDGKRYLLGAALRGKYESDSALNEFLPKFARWIGDYISDCIREHSFGFTPFYRQIVPTHSWTLCG